MINTRTARNIADLSNAFTINSRVSEYYKISVIFA